MMKFSLDKMYLEATPPEKKPWLHASRVLSIALMLALFMILGFLYDNVVAANYSFGSFSVNPRPDIWVEMLTIFVAGMVLPTHVTRMTQLFAWISTVFLLIPAAVLSAHQGSDRHAMFLMFAGVWLVMIICRLMTDFGIFFGLDDKPAIANVKIGWMVAILMAVLAALAWHVDGKVSFSFADVYEYRFDFNEALGFPLNYILPFAGGPLAGLVTASAIYKKSYVALFAVMVTGLLFFGLSSHKSMLFYPPFVAMVYLSLKLKNGHLYLMALFIFLTLATFFLVGTIWSDLLGSAFANRLVFIPAQIHYFFFREFGEIGPQLWAESRIGLGLHRPDIPLPSVNYIGLMMTGDPAVGANTGWIGNGYMNGNSMGIVVYAIILSATLHIIDRLGDRYGYAFVGAAFIVPIFNIVNSTDLLVGFLTGGMMFLFVIFFWLVRPIKPAVTDGRAIDGLV